MTNKFVVVDIETTGNSAKKGERIIQFAAVIIENGRMVDTYSTLVNPNMSIPPFIEELTGLTNKMVEDAPAFADIAPTIVAILEDAYFVAHNVLFDLTFLQEELLQAGFEGFFGPVLDTVELSRFLLPTSDSYKLSDLASQERLIHERPHQADSDAYVTAELFLRFIERLKNLPLVTLHQLLTHSGGLKSDIALFLDEVILTEVSESTVHSQIEVFEGIALRKWEPVHSVNTSGSWEYPYRDDEKISILKRGFPEWERRDGQLTMMDAVYQSLTDGTHQLIEAGCGVGKTLAYLLPSLLFAKQQGEQVVISTYTTQLQDQLLTKDIPLLNRMLSTFVHAVLLKGKHHYLDLAKFADTLEEEDDNYDTSLTKMQILVWLTETSTGDVEELNISSGGLLYWNRIRTGNQWKEGSNKWEAYDFYNRIKQQLPFADLIITNHSLLLADMRANGTLLPPYQYAVIDEAHHFEQATSDCFLQTFDYMTVRLFINQLGTYEQKQLTYRLVEQFKQHLIDPSNLNQLVTELQIELENLFKAIALFSRDAKKHGVHRIFKRISLEEKSRQWRMTITIAERLLFLFRDLAGIMEDWLSSIAKIKKLIGEQQSIYREIGSYLEQINENIMMIRTVFLQPHENWVRWIELDDRALQNLSTIYAKPITAASFLTENFFQKKKSIILTSATLTVNQSFDYLMEEWGLRGVNHRQLTIPSPFSYEHQVKLFVPNDLPEVNKVSVEEYVAAISEQIISITEATKGRMMILFTSNEMLKKTYELLKESGLLDDYALFAQGITSGSRARLVRNFKRFDKALLLGTSSFWEGVDIPGEALSCLVIVRLPFAPPDDPYTEARADRIRELGGNPFTEISLPEAVLRFKQGFGRLIRNNTDKGIVIIFDRRIVSSYYGKTFLTSIPTVPLITADVQTIIDQIEDWL